MAHDFINVKGLTARIKAVKEELAQLLHLETLIGGKPRRGRPAGVKTAKSKPAKRGRKGKRGMLGKKILGFLKGKKDGAHIKDIAAAAKTKPANVTAWMYSTGKSKVKKTKPGTFAAV